MAVAAPVSNQHLTTKHRDLARAEISTAPAPTRNKTSEESPPSVGVNTFTRSRHTENIFSDIYQARASPNSAVSGRQWREQPHQRCVEGKAICFSV